MALLTNINDLFSVDSTGAIEFNEEAGTAGYVLVSAGAGGPPVWTDGYGGNVTGSGTGQKVVKWTGSGANKETVGDGPITFATNDSTFAGIITASKNQNATSSFTFQNTDTTGTSVRTHLNATAGNRSIRLEAIHSDYSYVVSNNARMYFQTNSGSNNTLFLDDDNATFAGSVTAVGVSSTIGSATSGYFATSTAIPANQIVHVRDNVGQVATNSAGGIKISSSPGNDVFLLKRNDGGTSYFALQNSSATEFITTDMATGSTTFAGSVSATGVIFANRTLEVLGQNLTHGASRIKICQENTTKSQIRYYGADASTKGSLEFMATTSDGSSSVTPLSIDSSGNSTFAGQVTTSQPNSGLDYPILIGVGGLGSAVIGYQTRAQFKDIHNNAFNIDAANLGSSQWVKIGTLSNFGQSGYTFVLCFYGHTGYNATNGQDWNFKLFMKTSNGNAGGPHNALFNTWVEHTGNNTASPELKWVNTNASGTPTAGGTSFVLYMNVPQFVSGSIYTVKKHSGNWTSNNTTGQSDPGANSTTVLKAESTFNILNTDVGIGTVLPGAKLDVRGTGNFLGTAASGAALVTIENNSGSTATSYGLLVKGGGNSSSGKTFEVRDDSGNTDLIVKGDGDVGIGTDSPDVSGAGSSSTVLSVIETVGNRRGILELGDNQNADTGGIGSINFVGTYQDAGHKIMAEIRASGSGATSGQRGSSISMYTKENGTANIAERMRITSDGNVTFAIGSDTDRDANSIKHASNGFLYIKGGAAGISINDDGEDTRMILFNNGNIRFDAGTKDNAMIIEGSTGNVGIGVTGPTRKLEVEGGDSYPLSINSTQRYLQEFKRSGVSEWWFAVDGGSFIIHENGVGDKITIASGGTLTTTGDLVAYSDERLKSNIKTLDGSKVLKMRGVSFEKEGKKGSGVIAQELEKVAPELVNNDSEYKGVAYGNLTGYLIEAVKELKAEIEELKSNKCNCNK